MCSIGFLLVLLVVMDSATLATMASVKVYNQMATGSPIEVHCKSRTEKEVVPKKTLQNGESVEWNFKPSAWGITRFFCDFKWGALRYQSFNVWVDGPVLDFFHDQRPCTHCVWYVTLDGFNEYEWNNILGTPVAQYSWKVASA
jgi:hypothetical protein